MAQGEIIQVIGPSVDIRFSHDELPNLLNAVKIEYPADYPASPPNIVIRCSMPAGT